MASLAPRPHDPLLPQAAGGQAIGTALSLGVHAALAFALVSVMTWRSPPATVVAAELWASVPEAAAPPTQPAPVAAPVPVPAPAPPPPAAAEPPPPKVDIATERAEKARQERERRDAEADAARKKKLDAERKKREQDEAEARDAATEAERAEKARAEHLKRMMSQAGAAAGAGTSPGTAARDAAPSAEYRAKLIALIRSNTVFSGEVPGNPAAEVEVRAAASGTILSRRLLKSSGHAAWDDAVLRAIDRTGSLPRDSDGRVPGTVIISFRPKDQ